MHTCVEEDQEEAKIESDRGRFLPLRSPSPTTNMGCCGCGDDKVVPSVREIFNNISRGLVKKIVIFVLFGFFLEMRIILLHV